jgi:hypothetical protein
MRRLRFAGYYVGIVVLMAQVTEIILTAWPARVHSPTWRIAFVGGAARTVFLMLLVMFILTVVAVVAADRRFAFVLAALSVIAGVTFLVLSGVFALDAVQMRNQVRQPLADQYDFASAWVFIRQIIGVIGFAVLGMGAYRSARAIRLEARRATPKSTGLVVGGLSAPRVEKPVETPGA